VSAVSAPMLHEIQHSSCSLYLLLTATVLLRPSKYQIRSVCSRLSERHRSVTYNSLVIVVQSPVAFEYMITTTLAHPDFTVTPAKGTWLSIIDLYINHKSISICEHVLPNGYAQRNFTYSNAYRHVGTIPGNGFASIAFTFKPRQRCTAECHVQFRTSQFETPTVACVLVASCVEPCDPLRYTPNTNWGALPQLQSDCVMYVLPILQVPTYRV